MVSKNHKLSIEQGNSVTCVVAVGNSLLLSSCDDRKSQWTVSLVSEQLLRQCKPVFKSKKFFSARGSMICSPVMMVLESVSPLELLAACLSCMFSSSKTTGDT